MDGSRPMQIDAPIEGALMAVLGQSRDCIKIIALDGALRFMNDNGLKIMEIDSFDMVSNQPWWALWPEESRVLVSDAVVAALDGEDSRFEAFCPTAKGAPRWWDVSVSPIRDEFGTITHILSISRDISTSALERQESAKRAATAEMTAQMQTAAAQESRHRLKNLLTVVSSLTALVSRHAANTTDFRDRLRAHLSHMARAQDLLIGTNRRAATLRETVLAVVEADDRLRIADIPRVYISDQAVQLLALTLGELQTNAIKHGALGVDTGSVTLRVTEQDGSTRIVWTEDCREERCEPILANGTGIELLRRMLALQSEDGVDFRWTGNGLRVEFTMPTV